MTRGLQAIPEECVEAWHRRLEKVRGSVAQEIGKVRESVAQEIGKVRGSVAQEIGKVRASVAQEIGKVHHAQRNYFEGEML